MAYNVIANLGEYNTNYQINNKCNILTMDNEIMLCSDVELNDYTAGDTILTLSSQDMFPLNDIYIPCGLTIVKHNLLENSETFNPALPPFNNSNTSVGGNPVDGILAYRSNQQGNYIRVDFPSLTLGEKYYFGFEIARYYTYTTIIYQAIIDIGNIENGLGIINTGGWQLKTFEFTANSTTNNAIIKLGFPTTTGDLVACFKNFILSKTPINEWIDDTKNYYTTSLIKIDTSGNLSLMENVKEGTLHLNGICFHINDKYYNNTIGNINVTPSSPYGLR